MTASEQASEVGVIGLGVMGGNLARNLARNGFRVCGYNRNVDRAQRLAREHPEAKLAIAESFEELVRKLERPRRVLLMVPSGSPVDEMLDALDPLLADGDLVVDCGNSHFAETDRRFERAATRPWRFVGMGVSGGEEGALHGPSMMPGGEPEAWRLLEPMLEAIAARSESGPCVAWCGHRSAGHFVKMVHNGIEYAEMQHLAEATMLLRRGLGLEVPQLAEIFESWNEGPLESFLVEITGAILRTNDPQDPSKPIVDTILDRAGQKGTGRWTVEAALELGVAVPSIAAAVDARVLSSQLDRRQRTAHLLDDPERKPLEDVSPGDVHAALLASRIVAYAQGFEMLETASRERDYQTDLAEVARIWKAGCIIRARLLEVVRQSLADGPATDLVLAQPLRETLAECGPAWRRVVASATRSRLPVPGLAASLGWIETLSMARGSAALIQAQRDYFGAHRYERVDDPGSLVHHDWTGNP